ncbi:MAG: S8 family serine peptidase [Bacteroidetes bacterium]|nr:S8 family serine peptidase [Bacteroidota bacterium]
MKTTGMEVWFYPLWEAISRTPLEPLREPLTSPLSENAPAEAIIEEYNWAAAAEYADSAGADIINSSLGYTRFDDPSQDHSYADMDGNTTPISRAADIAATKGIVVCNSAGNEGNGSWFRISAPSDADSILCVGAVDATSLYASFSGKGRLLMVI